MNNQAIILFSGYNERAIIAFCRWAEARGVDYHIVAQDKSDAIFLTKYKRKVAFTRMNKQLITEKIVYYCSAIRDFYGYKRVVILPSTEFLNRFLLKHRTLIENDGCIIPLVNSTLYSHISDKISFVSLCQKYSINTPKQFDKTPDRPPFVAKPHHYLSHSGKQLVPRLIQTQSDFEKFKLDNSSDYFYQEFVTGKSIYLLAYIGIKDNILFSQENLIQQACGGSIILARPSDFHKNHEAKVYVDMLRKENYSGIIMIELRLDELNKTSYMIEANPRVWGPLQLIVDNNTGLLEAMLSDYGFDIDENVNLNTPAHYYWSGGISPKSQPMTYHDYSAAEFVADYHIIKADDLFTRADTIDLFLRELENSNES